MGTNHLQGAPNPPSIYVWKGFLIKIHSHIHRSQNCLLPHEDMRHFVHTLVHLGLPLAEPTVDGLNPAPPKKHWNDDSLVNTNKKRFPMFQRKWCEMDLATIHSMSQHRIQTGCLVKKHHEQLPLDTALASGKGSCMSSAKKNIDF